ncbi:hypothetical protein [Botrimarina sp.]|uniref:hypothetical protein n=1 Tax=Botrimarina sp. TaxID=2795802 RepID=UPI0032ED7106
MTLQRLLLSFVPLAAALWLLSNISEEVPMSGFLVVPALAFLTIWLGAFRGGSGTQVLGATLSAGAVGLIGYLLLQFDPWEPFEGPPWGIILAAHSPLFAARLAWSELREKSEPTPHDD